MGALQDIFGQREAIEAIVRAYRADRLPHGLIFAGPAGVGKATTARALAQLFLCQEGRTEGSPLRDEEGRTEGSPLRGEEGRTRGSALRGEEGRTRGSPLLAEGGRTQGSPLRGGAVGEEPCGKCASCVLMQAFNLENQTTNHPDYHLVYRQLIRFTKEASKARDLAVDVIRHHLVAPASLKAAMNHGKLFVVEEAELMNAAAQNALLKTLEEPYGRTLIILLTDQPHALLPTIRSRCQIIRFAALEPSVVQRELEKRGIDKSTAQQAGELSEGSLGVALKWIADGVVSRAQQLNGHIDALLSGKSTTDLAEWLKSAADDYAAKQLERDKQSSKDQATREGLVLYLRIAANRFRQRLHTADNPDELERSCIAIDDIVRSEGYLESNVNVSLALQQLGGGLERTFR